VRGAELRGLRLPDLRLPGHRPPVSAATGVPGRCGPALRGSDLRDQALGLLAERGRLGGRSLRRRAAGLAEPRRRLELGGAVRERRREVVARQQRVRVVRPERRRLGVRGGGAAGRGAQGGPPTRAHLGGLDLADELLGAEEVAAVGHEAGQVQPRPQGLPGRCPEDPRLRRLDGEAERLRGLPGAALVQHVDQPHARPQRLGVIGPERGELRSRRRVSAAAAPPSSAAQCPQTCAASTRR
jgi:hypothetical protein